ncbi:MAG TPA: putative glycoside hydrolase, partial [Phototrophicaceae bacterium]|nr:putative glycoside hydrolase [Phototrophicaceae bacterium]
MRVVTFIHTRVYPLLRSVNASRIIRQLALILIVALAFANKEAFVAQSEPQPVPLPGNSAGLSTSGNNGLSGSNSQNNTDGDLKIPSSDPKSCVTYKDPIQLAFFYNPPDGTGAGTMANNFDTYVYTRNFESAVDDLVNRGEYPVLQYLKFDDIHDPCFQAKKAQGTACSCSQSPNNNNVGWNKTDVCTIRDEHPDWFLRDKDGKLIYYEDHVMMDPGNQGWRDFWLARVKISQPEAKWSGVFIDNLATDFGAHHADTDIVLQKYTDDQYRAAVTGFHKFVYENYFQPNNKRYLGNIAVYWKEDQVWYDYAQYMDGGQDEFWALTRDGYYSYKSWKAQFQRWEETINTDNRAILVTQGSKGNNTRQLFGLASYLLLAGPKVYYRYASDEYYGQPWMYDNYKSPLGNPTGPYFINKNSNNQSVYIRKFENGKVKVTPAAHKAKIKV